MMMQCLKFKTDQAQEAKKMEKLNNIFFTLMARGPDGMQKFISIYDDIFSSIFPQYYFHLRPFHQSKFLQFCSWHSGGHWQRAGWAAGTEERKGTKAVRRALIPWYLFVLLTQWIWNGRKGWFWWFSIGFLASDLLSYMV